MIGNCCKVEKHQYCYSVGRSAVTMSRRLLRRVFHSQNFDGARLVQHAIKNNVVPMRDQLAHIIRQAGPPGAVKLRVLRKRQGLVA